MPEPATAIWGREDASAALPHVRGLQKLRSWLLLHVLGLPAPRGVIVNSWNEIAQERIEDFSEALGVSELLVRTDRPQETGRYPRGGYLAEVSALEQTSAELMTEGRVLFLLEPASPLGDLYSLVLASWPSDDYDVLEVVGPGFDASDIKRGDITPHERFMLHRGRPELRFGQHWITDEPTYRDSLEVRLHKVGALLARTRDPIRADATPDQAAVEEELRARGETLLLESAEGYRPIPRVLLATFWSEVWNLDGRLRALGESGRPFSVSMSFVNAGARRLYWDIVWPATKYDLS